MRPHPASTRLRLAAAAAAAFASAVSPARAREPAPHVTDNLTRNYYAAQHLATDNTATGGILTTPDSETRARARLAFANAAYSPDEPWHATRDAHWQTRTRIVLGATQRDDRYAAPAAPAAIHNTTAAVNLADSLVWRHKSHTTLTLYMDTGYQYTRHHAAPRAAAAALSTPAAAHPERWEAHVLTSLMDAGISKSFALTDDLRPPTPIEDPDQPRLRLETRFGNLMQYGRTPGLPAADCFLNTFVWTSGIELTLPLGTIAGCQACLTPFLQYTEFHDDGNRALSNDGRLFRAGFRATFRDADSPPVLRLHSAGDALSRRLAASSSASAFSAPSLADDSPAPAQFFLHCATFWGGDLSGFQLSAGFAY